MRILKNIWAQLHRFVFWAILISLFWSWIYLNFVGDVDREKKVLVCIDAYELDWRGLSLALEDAGMPEGIEAVQVRSFDYDIFGSSVNGDVYVMRESVLRATMEESPEKLAVLSSENGGWYWNGEVRGLRIFSAGDQTGPAMDYIRYALPGIPEDEAYYLCLDAEGPHAADGAAWAVAQKLMQMEP